MTSLLKSFFTKIDATRKQIASLQQVPLYSALYFTRNTFKKLAFESSLNYKTHADFFSLIAGKTILDVVQKLGPFYGKMLQMIVMAAENDSPKSQAFVELLQLDKIFKEWDPMPFSIVKKILDRDCHGWRDEFNVLEIPLGVASLGQVHEAIDQQGQKWAIKIVKPEAKKKLEETIQALTFVTGIAKWFLPLRKQRVWIRDFEHLLKRMAKEPNLKLEKNALVRAEDVIRQYGDGLMRVPHVYEKWNSDNILIMEKLEGVAFSDIIANRIALSEIQKSQLAKAAAKNLLIMIFDAGFFHADPHGGNILLMNSGEIGLFDWGLTGELSEKDRKHISQILKAIMIFDVNKLVDALHSLAIDSGAKIGKEKIKKSLLAFKEKIPTGEISSLNDAIDLALNSAEQMRIKLPQGLILMVKTIVMIDNLAKGLDPNASLAKIAPGVLLRAARPSVGELVKSSFLLLKKQIT